MQSFVRWLEDLFDSAVDLWLDWATSAEDLWLAWRAKRAPMGTFEVVVRGVAASRDHFLEDQIDSAIDLLPAYGIEPLRRRRCGTKPFSDSWTRPPRKRLLLTRGSGWEWT